jgi:hypothetical protein
MRGRRERAASVFTPFCAATGSAVESRINAKRKTAFIETFTKMMEITVCGENPKSKFCD